jgi:hypothetical protein
VRRWRFCFTDRGRLQTGLGRALPANTVGGPSGSRRSPPVAARSRSRRWRAECSFALDPEVCELVPEDTNARRGSGGASPAERSGHVRARAAVLAVATRRPVLDLSGSQGHGLDLLGLRETRVCLLVTWWKHGSGSRGVLRSTVVRDLAVAKARETMQVDRGLAPPSRAIGPRNGSASRWPRNSGPVESSTRCPSDNEGVSASAVASRPSVAPPPPWRRAGRVPSPAPAL